MDHKHLRNVAVIAHVDHGKTTLTDQLLYQSGMFRSEELDKLAGGQHNLVLDTGDIERERGITITAKNCAVSYRHKDGHEYTINLIDTPGHADFGGEVERVLNMADGCLLVVDAFEGPMPQTRFVLGKALALGLKPVVVVNKIDKPNARPEEVVNEVFDLLGQLDAPDDALDFPVVYASAKNGWATADHDRIGEDHPDNIADLYDAILSHIPEPYAEGSARGAAAGFTSRQAALDSPLQLSVTSIQYSEYVGRIAVGRVTAGTITGGQKVTVINRAGEGSQQRVLKVNVFDGLSQREVASVSAGDICAVVGLDPIDIGDTIACPDDPSALPSVKIDEPTLSMMFRVNDSPFAGKEGTYVTSRQIWDRLQRELQSNVALRVERGETGESFLVSGRGLMHLGVLIEEMRREGYELQVGRPQVILRRPEEGDHAGKLCEPIEQLVVDCPEECQSDVMSLVSNRRAEIVRMDPKAGASDYIHIEFTIPARGLLGLRTRMLTATQGRAIMHHNLLRYEPVRGEMPSRLAGVMIASDPGQVTAYSLDRLFDRGVFFVKPGDKVYAGQIVGEHCKDNDITVNLAINKKLTNVRAASADDQTKVKPARELSLEATLEYIAEDELVEITPESVRMRKRLLTEAERRREDRAAKAKSTVSV
ncbi:translational GTPase TypA [Mucisphaera calidilacus]|uniref:Large ribosomal subunit assembly factor BipA n=1 Tax=Mucisphaera calidilacus TaxID=2527982 RepID=A0A518BUQ2_9BACT|nr:translational GTPase TypA [Mucisphaera calidilacus]QDU70681.1 GTP-binding protein TypA/BipA [Mucisphaera calidilacus]